MEEAEVDGPCKCAICGDTLEDGRETFMVTEKGIAGLNRASVARGTPPITVSVGQRLHVGCRRTYTDARNIDATLAKKRKLLNDLPDSSSLRSQEPEFNFKDHCFLCGTKIESRGKGDDDSVYSVRTWDCQRSIITACDARLDGDSWAQKVQDRIIFARDLPAVDAVYHQVCNVNFRNNKRIPERYRKTQEPGDDAKVRRLGRPVDTSREDAFLRVVDELRENDDEQTTVADLVARMSEITSHPYTVKWMKERLMDYLGDSIVITNINGRSDVVTFRTTAAKILQAFYDAPRLDDEEMRKRHIIRTAAQLIKTDIKCMQTSKQNYPEANEIRSLETNLVYLPETLRTFLNDLFSGKSKDLKVASIGQCIVQMTRPRIVLAPIPFGLAVQMHHQFGSRFLIDSLASHGLCVSYSEVINYSKCAAACFHGTDIPMEGHFGLYIADNVDHNLRTLDGHGTFHGMGIIAAVTPGLRRQWIVPRMSVPSDSLDDAKIAIKFYKTMEKRAPLVYEELRRINIDDSTRHLDTMWKISWSLRPKTPGWSGTMQAIRKGTHPGKASIHFLPMIDMDPTDMSCVYSTLHFIATENKRQGSTPIVTFDQPLWWKSKTIILHEGEVSELKPIVLILGGFHTVMSYLGCIGHIMHCSGLKEVLELAYAENAVSHMLTGKAYARAVRGHFLVDTALNTMVLSGAYNIPVAGEHEGDDDDDDDHVVPADIETALQHFDALLLETTDVEMVITDDVFNRIDKELESEKIRLASYPTGRLWIQYMRMVDLLRMVLRAQRTGDFKLYLKSLVDMLPFLAAAGHTHYTKSVHLHLQDMLQLEDSRPDIYNAFMSGLYVVRRSDRFWAGLPTDLVIEQSLMRTVKTTGGLTRGRGMEESQRTRWLLAQPACAEVNEAMQDLTEANFVTSEQHKDMSEARKARDHKDTLKILEYFQDYSPFPKSDELHNIATGITADSACNQHIAEDVGNAILKTLEGQDAFQFSFRRKDQVVRMGQKVVSVDGDEVVVDPQLLFQRLLIVANNSNCDLDELLKHELSTYPTSLFDKHGFLREATKPQLSEAMAYTTAAAPQSRTASQQTAPEYHVFDGGSLIHRFQWKKGATFSDIVKMYVDYVLKFSKPTVVFDGYQCGSSTKDATHLRRSKGAVGPKVLFSSNMSLKSKKDNFLANTYNKQAFIDLLCDKLQEKNIRTLNADGDADVLVAMTGIECAKMGATHVIGEDTDILVLLVHHAKADLCSLIYRSDKPKRQDKTAGHWDVNQLRMGLGDCVAGHLPFIHAVAGCDTTSRLFGIGKGVPLRKMQSATHFKRHAADFCTATTKKDIQLAGEKALVCLYGGKERDTLETLRLQKFRDKVAKSAACVQIQGLPPTSDAAKYHSFRVFHQVKAWMGEEAGESLKPEDWGWKLDNDRLVPRTMDLPPAPPSILKIIRCQCQGDCSTNRCSCRNNGLTCTDACGTCRGSSCSNIPSLPLDLEHSDNLELDMV